MERDWCSQHGEILRIAVQIMSNAGRSEVAGEIEGALKIRLKALPIEARANDALVKFMADKLGVSKSRVSITHGLTSRLKRLEVQTDQTVAQAKVALLGM